MCVRGMGKGGKIFFYFVLCIDLLIRPSSSIFEIINIGSCLYCYKRANLKGIFASQYYVQGDVFHF